MPSNSMDSCAGVTAILPSLAAGQTNRPFLKPFAEKACPLGIPPDNLQQVATPTTEHEQMAGIGIKLQNLLGLRRQPY
jgi:hypothetical protein